MGDYYCYCHKVFNIKNISNNNNGTSFQAFHLSSLVNVRIGQERKKAQNYEAAISNS
jgi:hypothetical protein